MQSQRIMRLPEVIEAVSLKKTTVYDLIRRGIFPVPIRLGLRSVGWYETEINDWLQSRARAR